MKYCFTYRLAIQYLIGEKQLSIWEIATKDIDYRQIKEILKDRYCSELSSVASAFFFETDDPHLK